MANNQSELSTVHNLDELNTFISSYKNALSKNEKEAVKNALQLIEQLRDQNIYNEACKILIITGNHFQVRSEFDEAIRFFEGCLEIEEADQFYSLEAYNGLGDCYWRLGDYKKSLESYMKALNKPEIEIYLEVKARTLGGIANVHFFLNNYEESISYDMQCIELKEKLNDIKGMGISFSNMAETYIKKEDYETALDNLKKALALIDEDQDGLFEKDDLADIFNNLGTVHLKMNNFRDSIGYLRKGLKYSIESNTKYGEALVNYNLGIFYHQTFELKEAVEHLERSLELAEEINSNEIIAQCSQELYTIHKENKSFEEALAYSEKYNATKEILLKEDAKNMIRVHEYELEIKARELEKKNIDEQNKKLKEANENLKILSDLGYQISNFRKLTDIQKIVYEDVNKLMNAAVFGIGFFDENKQEIIFPGAMENGEVLPAHSHSLGDNSRLAVHCFKTQSEIIIGDYKQEFNNYIRDVKLPAYPVGDLPDSAIFLPLVIRAKPVGILTVQCFEKNAYSENQIEFLKNLSIYVASAIVNIQLFDNMESEVENRTNQISEAYDNVKLLGEIGQEIISSHDIEHIFSYLHERINMLMDATIFGIRLYHPSEHQVEYKYEIENGERFESERISMDDDDNFTVWCIKNKESIFINNNRKEYKKYTNKIIVVSGEMPNALIFCPMIIRDEVIGVITVQSFDSYVYSEYHLDILKTLASYTAIAIDNASLYNLLEAKVEERTEELRSQKVEVEKAHENLQILGEIGKQIISHLSVQDIINETYHNVNKLMDASVFGIGVYDPEDDAIFFPHIMEKGQPLPSHKHPLSNKEKPAVWCFDNQKEIFINDREKDYKKYVKQPPTTRVGEMPQSVLYLPVSSSDKKIGVITVQSFQKNSYTHYHLNILSNIALYVAIALENARLYNNMEQEVLNRTQEIKTAYNNVKLLGNIGQKIISSLDFEKMFHGLHENVNKLMDATIFGVRIYHRERNEVEYKYEFERNERFEPEYISMEEDDNFTVWCIKNNKPVFINDIKKDYKRYTKKIIVVSGDMPNSLIFCPMMVGEKTIGVITVQSFEKNAYTDYHLNILRTLASYTAIGLENASLYNSLEEKVKERTSELSEKNESIMDSITYAKRIQHALLEDEEHVTESLPPHFIYFNPKDIVSGDFYWSKRIGDYWYTSVVDCTGHGVPGAFMSVLGIASLNELINTMDYPEPNEILDALKGKIVKDLSQKGRKNDSNDGMDITLVKLNLKTYEMSFSGANNPLYILKNGDVKVIKGTKQPISYTKETIPYKNHSFKLKSGDTFYMFSDGFADQFGGERGRKYNYKRFREFLSKNYFRHMKIQKVLIHEEFETWRKTEDQVDDICVVGIKVP